MNELELNMLHTTCERMVICQLTDRLYVFGTSVGHSFLPKQQIPVKALLTCR